MIIAVNAVTPAFKPAATDFLQNAFLLIAAQQPQHQFVFIGFTTAAKTAPTNCSFSNTGLTIKSPLRFTYWLNYKLPSLLKKNKAEILVSYNSCSMRFKLPQLLYADDASFLINPADYKNNWLKFYTKNTGRFLQKVQHIITASHFLKKTFTEQYSIEAEKISVVYAAPDALFKPFAHWNQKETIKEKLTDGKEYFLYSGPLHTQQNLINLLKAFTFFKQRQKSNMMLVLASVNGANAVLLKSLSSYKLRAQVVLAENLPADELAQITAAAYAMVYAVNYDAACTPVMQALQCHTPVIASNNSALPEVCGEAAAYCHPDDYNDIAAKMMLLFTNEDRRNQLIGISRQQAEKFQSDGAPRQLWSLMQQHIH